MSSGLAIEYGVISLIKVITDKDENDKNWRENCIVTLLYNQIEIEAKNEKHVFPANS